MATYDLKTLTGFIENERARSRKPLEDLQAKLAENKKNKAQMDLAKMQIDAGMDELKLQLQETRERNKILDARYDAEVIRNKEIYDDQERLTKALTDIATQSQIGIGQHDKLFTEIQNDYNILLETNEKINTLIAENQYASIAYNNIPEAERSFQGEKVEENTKDLLSNLTAKEKNQQNQLDFKLGQLKDLNKMVAKANEFEKAFKNVKLEDGKITEEGLNRVKNEWLADNVENYHPDNPQHSLYTTVINNNISDLVRTQANNELDNIELDIENKKSKNKNLDADTKLKNAQAEYYDKRGSGEVTSQDLRKYRDEIFKYSNEILGSKSGTASSAIEFIQGVTAAYKEDKFSIENEGFQDLMNTYDNSDVIGGIEKDRVYEQIFNAISDLGGTGNDIEGIYEKWFAGDFKILEQPMKYMDEDGNITTMTVNPNTMQGSVGEAILGGAFTSVYTQLNNVRGAMPSNMQKRPTTRLEDLEKMQQYQVELQVLIDSGYTEEQAINELEGY